MFYLDWARSHLSLFVILLLLALFQSLRAASAERVEKEEEVALAYESRCHVAFARESEMIRKRFGRVRDLSCSISCCLSGGSRRSSSR